MPHQKTKLVIPAHAGIQGDMAHAISKLYCQGLITSRYQPWIEATAKAPES